ncbi:MAG: NHL repeat-containing protein [Bacteroidota bacterium]
MRLSLQRISIFLVLLASAVITFSGCNKSSDDTTNFIPVVTTNNIITNLTTTSAMSGGYVTNFVTGTVTEYGVCWSATNKTPVITDSKTALTTANVIRFSAAVTGLSAKTLYYLRAYATDNKGATVYGGVIQFTTPTTTFAITGTVSTYAGSGTIFNSPQGVVADGAGNLYIADSFNNSIRKVSSTGTITTLAGSATPGYNNATGAAASFYSPQNIAIDASGNLYVSDVGNNAIRKITATGVVTTLAGGNGPGFVDATGSSAKFTSPAGLVVDASGNVYVADRGNNAIRKITSAGVVTTIAGAQASGFADGLTTTARFSNPSGITIDAQGVLYVVDLSNNALRQIATDGTVTTLAGNPTTQTDLLNLPVAITTDKSGNMFISDESGRIMELVAATKVLYSIAGSANTAGYTEGAGTTAKFNAPMGLTTDAAGNVYVADYNNNVIRKLVVSTTP